MLSFEGEPENLIAKVYGGEDNGSLIYLLPEEPCCMKCSEKCEKKKCCKKCHRKSIIGRAFIIEDMGKIQPLLKIHERSVAYVAGPSGSGKSTYASNLIKKYLEIFPEKDLYIFSRTNYKDDPTLKDLKAYQISLDDNLLKNPIDITQELKSGQIILFDDCNTIQDDKLKKMVDKLMKDIMEIGRKLGITIIITNHLVIPDEKKIARAILNEMQYITFFPKSGSAQQIQYAIKKYIGLSDKQIRQIMDLPSRWVTIYKNYPQYVMFEKGIFLL